MTASGRKRTLNLAILRASKRPLSGKGDIQRLENCQIAGLGAQDTSVSVRLRRRSLHLKPLGREMDAIGPMSDSSDNRLPVPSFVGAGEPPPKRNHTGLYFSPRATFTDYVFFILLLSYSRTISTIILRSLPA